ncbi:hypothetical protein J6590_067501 [Homalodisca vitripennis]|nr:hypothetical protein J6590_067501 [Homalodisca vitripennis]
MCDVCRLEKESVSSKKSSATVITKDFLISTMNSFKNEVFSELQSYSKEFKYFKSSIEIFSGKMDNATELMNKITEEMKSAKEEARLLREENSYLRTAMQDLEMRMRDMDQYSRISNIEMSGVPVSQNEDLESLLCDISKAINVELKEESVEAAHRVPSYNKKRAAPIVVKFKSRRDKETWINGFKATRPLTADKTNPRMPKEKVFINEHLSPANKQLLSKTKEAARTAATSSSGPRTGRSSHGRTAAIEY